MEEWKEYKIADICNIKHGFAFKGQYFTETEQNYICVTPGNFGIKGGFKLDKPKYYYGPIPKDYILHADDLIVTMTDLSKDGDTLGYSALIPQNSNCIFLHNQRIGLIEKISSEIDKHFLYWIMRTYNYQKYIVNHCSGSTVKHTSPTNIGSYVFKAPSLEKQKNLVSFLDNIETKIELNRRINENLEQQAQALFKSWFVDFEPFKDGKFVDSELGMIPEGWRVGYYTELVDIKGGGTPKTNIKEFWNGSIPFFSPKDIGPSCFVLNTEKYITTNGLENCNSNLFPPYSVFITARGTVGKVVMVGSEMAMNQSNYALLGKQNISQFYVYLITLQLVSHLLKKANGAVFNAITTRDFASERIIIPFYSIIKSFSSIVKPIYENILLNEFQIKSLSQLRDTLLPRLMSGELKLSETTI